MSEIDTLKDSDDEKDTIDNQESTDSNDVIEEEESKKYVYEKRTPYAYTKPDIQKQVAISLGAKFNSVKNGEIVEKFIVNASILKAIYCHIQSRMSNEKFKQIYISIVYDVLNSKDNIKDIISQLKNGHTIWNHPIHKNLFVIRETEESDFADEMEVGLYECGDCRRKGQVYNKTRSVSIQTRSGDEGMTLYISCMNCRKVWKIYN